MTCLVHLKYLLDRTERDTFKTDNNREKEKIIECFTTYTKLIWMLKITSDIDTFCFESGKTLIFSLTLTLTLSLSHSYWNWNDAIILMHIQWCACLLSTLHSDVPELMVWYEKYSAADKRMYMWEYKQTLYCKEMGL